MGNGVDHTGVADHDVESAEALLCGGHGVLHRVEFGHVAGQGEGAVADPGGQLRDLVGAAREQSHVHARLGEDPRSGGTDAAAGAGDQRCLPFKTHREPPYLLHPVVAWQEAVVQPEPALTMGVNAPKLGRRGSTLSERTFA